MTLRQTTTAFLARSAGRLMSETKGEAMRCIPEAIDDTALDAATGGRLMDTESSTFGFEPITLERGARAPEWRKPRKGDAGGFIGETEKNVWKAPAGLEASVKSRT